MGFVRYGTVTVALTMLIVGVPSAYFLAFTVHLREIGAYLGIVISIAIVAFLFTMNLIFFIDWSRVTIEVSRQTMIHRKEKQMVLI